MKSTETSERVYVSRREAAMRFGLTDAGQISKWKRRGWPLPPKCKPAIKVGEEVYEAKAGERLHCEIVRRLGQQTILDYEEGFTYEPVPQSVNCC